ncbi:uncharacterized protein LOC130777926 isoform X1 [Actinidia eriantha]|uniref:uncharacterized protein LOC130777926 isoform X1 n=1 Tax=Actinidia eriantha TaxID=165200 RepID=UPI00258FAB57|nr:uncharacterized protein LOC130777926 isoform X1 [Actinidia eriantha]
MAVNSCGEGQDAYSISVSPDEGVTNMQCESQLALIGHLEVPNTTNTQMCSGDEMNSRNHISLEMDNADAYSPCIVDMDIEKGNSGAPKTNDEAVDKLKIEGPLPKALQRQISLQIGEKFMQLLMNDSFVLPKYTSRDKPMTEKVHETPNNKARKYKRSASFNSRKVVLLFSVLSIIGTMILIYLTLRVRQIGDIGSLQV